VSKVSDRPKIDPNSDTTPTRVAIDLQRENALFREAMQEFVDRCEAGEVRSQYTYNKFRELLS